MQRNKLLQSYLQRINEIENKTEKYIPELKSLKREITHSLEAKKDWDSFITYFEKTNRSFIKKLKERADILNQNELRLAALIRLGMTNKEIGMIFNISSQSVRNATYRLKKKVNIPENVTIREFILGL